MKKKLYLVVNKSTKRIVAWNARQDERDGLLTQLNRFGTQQYIAGSVTFDGDMSAVIEPAGITCPQQFQPEFEAACEKIRKRGV